MKKFVIRFLLHVGIAYCGALVVPLHHQICDNAMFTFQQNPICYELAGNKISSPIDGMNSIRH